MTNKFEVIIYWNDADAIYVAEIPELKGCIAHGGTMDEALSEVNNVAAAWLEIAQQEGWNIPQPKGRLMFA